MQTAKSEYGYVCRKYFHAQKAIENEKTMEEVRLRRSGQEKVLTNSDTMKCKLMYSREVNEKTDRKYIYGYSWLWRRPISLQLYKTLGIAIRSLIS